MGTLKLGLKIDRAYNGLSTLLVENETTLWIKYVTDVRPDCKHIIGLKEGSGASVVLYTATEVGEFYTIVNFISGRTGDYISAWIFCPLDIEIPGDELSKIIETTRKEILSNRLDEDRLHRLFSTEYQAICVPKVASPTDPDGSKYAVRYYGQGGVYSSLSELLSCNMAQPDNRNYKGIFLIERKSGLSASEDCVDVSDTILKESFIIKTPKVTLGYQPYYNGRPFVKPIRLIKGDKLAVIWKKEGYKDVRTETVIESRDTIIKSVTEADERFLIGFRDFAISDEDGLVDKSNLIIKVGETEINSMSYAAVLVSRLSNCTVTVLGKGYKAFRNQVDLRRRPVRIRLEEESFIYKCRIPLDVKPGVKAKCIATIESNMPLRRIPIKGYHSEDGLFLGETADLYYKEPKNYRKVLIITCAAFFVGLIVGGSVMFCASHCIEKRSAERSATTYETKSTNPGGDGAHSTEADITDSLINNAVNYLEQNPQWIKSDMEEIDSLKGVWEELNSYKYDDLVTHKLLIDRSGTFKTIVDSLKNRAGLKGQKYCKSKDDTTITRVRYLKTIEKPSSGK